MVDRPNWPILEKWSLDEARKHVGEVVDQILENRDGKVYIVNHPTGTGKTTAVLSRLKLWNKGEWPKRPDGKDLRVLYLAKNNKAIDEAQALVPFAFRHYGRATDPASPAHCIKLDALGRASNLGLSPVEAVCMSCPNLKGCTALAHSQAATKERLVIAYYDTYLNFGDRLDGFDVVVIDEELTARLWRKFELTVSDLQKWLQGMDRANGYSKTGPKFPDDHPARVIVEALAYCANDSLHMNSRGQGFKRFFENRVKLVREHDHRQQVRAYMDQLYQDKDESFTFESQALSKGAYKLFARLVAAIVEDKGAILAAEGKIKVGVPLDNALQQLDKATLINLDATPNLYLINAIFGKRWLRTVDEVIDLNLNVTQYGAAIYSAPYITDATNLADIKSILSRFIAPYSNPLIVSLQKAMPVFDAAGAVTNAATSVWVDHPNVDYIYFGHETRSLNAYDKCDAVFIVGHWLEQIDALRLKVGALRRDGVRQNVLPAVDYRIRMEQKSKNWAYQAYWQPNLPIGLPAKARLRSNGSLEQDPLARLTIDHSLCAEVIQAIGRTRPLAKSEPLDVYVINGAVYRDLPVNKLLFREDLFGDNSARPHAAGLHNDDAAECQRMVLAACASGCGTIKAIQDYCQVQFGRRLNHRTVAKYRS